VAHNVMSITNVRILVELFKMPIDMFTTPTLTGPDGMTPLQLACMVGSQTLVRYFLQIGANPAHYDNQGRNALHWLCSQT
jgi:ankyrin repeat protein